MTNRQLPSCLLQCFVVFRLQVHIHANQTHFHMKEFARGLVLKQRHKLTRKWPCLFLSFSDCGGISDDQKKRLPQKTNKRNVYLGL